MRLLKCSFLAGRTPQLAKPRVAAAADPIDAVGGCVRLVVVLVVVLATPERGERQDLRHHARKAMRLLERDLRLLGSALLTVVGVEDDRPVLRAVIAEL